MKTTLTVEHDDRFVTIEADANDLNFTHDQDDFRVWNGGIVRANPRTTISFDVDKYTMTEKRKPLPTKPGTVIKGLIGGRRQHAFRSATEGAELDGIHWHAERRDDIGQIVYRDEDVSDWKVVFEPGCSGV